MQERFLAVIEESYQNLYLSKKLNLIRLTDRVRNKKIAAEILSKSHPTDKEIYYVFNLHFGEEMAQFAELIHIHKEMVFLFIQIITNVNLENFINKFIIQTYR